MLHYMLLPVICICQYNNFSCQTLLAKVQEPQNWSTPTVLIVNEDRMVSSAFPRACEGPKRQVLFFPRHIVGSKASRCPTRCLHAVVC